MTPLLAALSSRREAVRSALVVSSALPESAASRKRRTAVLSSLLTALLRRRRRSLVPMRLIWLLMLATRDYLGFLQNRPSTLAGAGGKPPGGEESPMRRVG